ncbi:MAG: DUF4914 family protein [Planctomycetota bacterium]|nr:DUF4914 family protein [Planctomycetota bacterium]
MPEVSFDRVKEFVLPADVMEMLRKANDLVIPENRAELLRLSLGGNGDRFEVQYPVPKRGTEVEAIVTRCRNGLAVSYPDPYMRRRDPDCMLVAGDMNTDKRQFQEKFGQPFGEMRTDIIDWLADHKLIVMGFYAGGHEYHYGGLLICPVNTAFFATALGDLQEMVPLSEMPRDFAPRAVVFVAPPFRHTHCDGRQMVVHHRDKHMHEVFSLNLYPGPSAKKGIYGVLLAIGEEEGWITAHGSTVQVVTPYDNIVTIMHEGASGGGKSEMLEYPHREQDGRLLLGKNTVTGERRKLSLHIGCTLHPVTDDMALCHPNLQQGNKLVVSDAEDAWFVRINHITGYGTDPNLERLTTTPPEPLIFINLVAVPNATCLIWEHEEDEPGKPCPNPRVIVPRRIVPNVVNEPVAVDVRSFGVRTPPCTRERPSYGIVGLLHFLPPALAWLWRLVAPRGYANPSVTDSEAMVSEGVGSYWPFATGRRVDQANLLLRQIEATPGTRYVLTPNQHIGAWQVGFTPQWIAREYLARRGGAKFRADQLSPARCPLLGYSLNSIVVEGTQIAQWFLQVDTQPEVGKEGYDQGAKLLGEFFRAELEPYLKEPDLHPLGRTIIEAFMKGADLKDFEAAIPVK